MSECETIVPVCDESSLVEAVRAHDRLAIVAGGSKTGLHATAERALLPRVDLSALNGIVDYQPTEFTITMRAATRLVDVDAALASEGQFLPFDPPSFGIQSTIGGTIAAGLSGSCRLRYGGVRDFCLAVRAVDGAGNRIVGGCPVVKNAAGFDLPKLLVGSCGSLAAMTQVTLKVFPRPVSNVTVRVSCGTLPRALALQTRLARLPIEIDAIDLEPPDHLLLRVSGTEAQAKQLAERIVSVSGDGELVPDGQRERDCWADTQTPRRLPAQSIARVPIVPNRIEAFERQLRSLEIRRRYAAAGNVAWLWMDSAAILTALEAILTTLGLTGLVIYGTSEKPLIGKQPAHVFGNRVKGALDPNGTWYDPFA